MTTALFLLSEAGLDAVAWARRAAAARSEQLVVICAAQDAASRCEAVRSGARPDDAPAPLAATLESLADDKGLTIIDCRGPDLRRAVLHAAADCQATRVILHTELDERGEAHRALVRRIARAAPYDLIVLAVGDCPGDAPSRILVPQLGGGGAHALRLAARATSPDAIPVRALPDPRRLPRSRRTYRKTIERLPAGVRARCEQRDEPAPTMDEAIRTAVRAGDLVLVDAEAAGQIPRLIRFLRDLQRDKADAPFAVAVARAEDAAGPGRFERVFERARRYAPALERDARKSLYERIETGGRVSTDFVVMLTLSAAIAALGLVQSSTAVVIGAMLVAPLMTPLVAAGMALTQANIRLFRDALKAMAVGVAGALAVSLVVGLLSPWRDLSAEVVARAAPNLFDLAIAALSGVAAAYALARPGLAGTLVGVAIAVALVPPIAAVGIAATHAEFAIALGAATLFITNLFAIILGAAFVFRVFGLDVARRDDAPPRWVRAVVALLMLGVAVTAVPLAGNLTTQLRHGVNRPYARPLPPDLRDAIRARVAQTPGVEILLMAESAIEHGFGVEVVLLTRAASDDRLVADLHDLIRRELGDDAPARVLTVRAAD